MKEGTSDSEVPDYSQLYVRYIPLFWSIFSGHNCWPWPYKWDLLYHHWQHLVEISVPRKVKCFLVQLICHRYKSFSNINQTLISSKEGNLGLNLRGGRGYQSMMLMLRGLRVEFRRIMGPSLRDTAFGRGASSRNLGPFLSQSSVQYYVQRKVISCSIHC